MMNLRYRADKSVPESVLAQANALDLSAYSEADLASLSHSQSEAASDFQAAIASLTGTSDTPAQGDTALTTADGNAKTEEEAPIALAVAAVSLAGAAILFSKKRSRSNLP